MRLQYIMGLFFSLSDQIVTFCIACCCSPQPGLCDSWGILDAIRKVKVGDSGVKSLEISSSVPVSQSTEIGYLNVTSPVAPNSRLEQEESLSATSDEA